VSRRGPLYRDKFGGGGSADWTTLNLSTATESNTGQKGGSTVLGSSSTVECAAVHGAPDGGNDAYMAVVALGVNPSTTEFYGIEVELECTGLPADTPSAGTSSLYVVASGTAALTVNEGHYCGIRKNNSSVYKHGDARRVGASGGSGDTLVGAPMRARLFVIFDETKGDTAASSGSGDTSGKDSSTQSSAWSSAATEVYVGILLDMTAASPTQALTWSGVSVKWRPIEAPS